MSNVGVGKYKSITGGAEATHSQALTTPIRGLVFTQLSGTAPIYLDFKRDSAPTAASSQGDNLHVLSPSALAAREFLFPTGSGRTVYFSFFSTAAAEVYIEMLY